jgi:hypothetical protein
MRAIFRRGIERTYLLTGAVFSSASGRNQFLERLRAFGDIATKENVCRGT